MPLNILEQSSFLYESNWTAEIDALLLSTVVRMKKDLKWNGMVIPMEFLLEAQLAIKETIGLHFTPYQLYGRLETLEHRYLTFKKVVAVPGTFWNVHSNTVTAPDKVWNHIFELNPLARAYYHKGEPEYRHLAIFFGLELDEIMPKTKKVIIISNKP